MPCDSSYLMLIYFNYKNKSTIPKKKVRFSPSIDVK